MVNRSYQVLEIYIETVENARQFKNLTHTVIAERLDCTRQPISKFFNGKPVSCALFVGICEMLDLGWQKIAGLTQINVDNANLGTSILEMDIEVKSLPLSQPLP